MDIRYVLLLLLGKQFCQTYSLQTGLLQGFHCELPLLLQAIRSRQWITVRGGCRRGHPDVVVGRLQEDLHAAVAAGVCQVL